MSRVPIERLTRPAPVEWLCLLAGLFLTIQYGWLMDDAFVYFRYADNAVLQGNGLVYNQGEYVEGYSSPLWMSLLVLLRTTGVNYWILIRLLGIASFVCFWWLLVRLNRAMAPQQAQIVNLPLCLLCLNYAVLCYFTSGLETPLVQVAAALYALFVVRSDSRWLQVAIALSPWIRPELAVPFLLALVLVAVRTRRFPLWMTVFGAGFGLVWMSFRIYTYADLFPNTFYLKNTVDWVQGLAYWQDTARAYALYPLAVLLVVCFWLLWMRVPTLRAELRGRERLWMVALALPVLVYVLKIGGDPRHYRYVAFPFVLLSCAGAGLIEQYLAHCAPRAGLAVLLSAVAITASFLAMPRQLSAHPLWGDPVHTPFDKINDAHAHRTHATLHVDPWGSGAELEQKQRYGPPGSAYLGVANDGWCVRMYEQPELRWINSWGLTDAFLARTKTPAARTAHKPGLLPMAKDIVVVYLTAQNRPQRGMFRKAIELGYAAAWISANLEAIEVIERKVFNRHDFRENLALALKSPAHIRPD